MSAAGPGVAGRSANMLTMVPKITGLDSSTNSPAKRQRIGPGSNNTSPVLSSNNHPCPMDTNNISLIADQDAVQFMKTFVTADSTAARTPKSPVQSFAFAASLLPYTAPLIIPAYTLTAENIEVMTLPKTNFRGVHFNRASGKWRAQIERLVTESYYHSDGRQMERSYNKKMSLGCFETDVLAAHAYDDAAWQALGPHAHLNFPGELLSCIVKKKPATSFSQVRELNTLALLQPKQQTSTLRGVTKYRKGWRAQVCMCTRLFSCSLSCNNPPPLM